MVHPFKIQLLPFVVTRELPTSQIPVEKQNHQSSGHKVQSLPVEAEKFSGLRGILVAEAMDIYGKEWLKLWTSLENEDFFLRKGRESEG